MPILKVQTNQFIDEKTKEQLLIEASKIVSSILKKPEYYIMVSIEQKVAMLFNGTTEPLAYLELKSIGLPNNYTMILSENLCLLLKKFLEIPTERIYIEFTNLDGNMLGWNTKTFK